MRAMILAAGRGERLRPLTDSVPKPLVELAGRPLIEYHLAALAQAGFREVVINQGHLGGQLAAALGDGHRWSINIHWSDEQPTALETGGGIKRALPLLGDAPFYAINGDVYWLDGAMPALNRLAQLWDDSKMDALLLLHPTSAAIGFHGPGDYRMDPLGRLSYRLEREVPPFVYAGVQILHPRLFRDAPEAPFSVKQLWDRAEAAERLYGLRHDGLWCHVGSPAEMAEVEETLLRALGRPRRDTSAEASAEAS